MKRRGLTVSGQLVVVLVLASAMMGLRYPTAIGASAIFTATLAILVTGVLIAVYVRGRARGSAVGFALFGWVYLALGFGPFPQAAIAPPLLPMALLDDLAARMNLGTLIGGWPRPGLQSFPQATSSYMGPYTVVDRGGRQLPVLWGVPPTPELIPFYQTGQSLAVLLAAILGGFLGGLIASGAASSRPGEPTPPQNG